MTFSRSFRFLDDPMITQDQARLGLMFELPESDNKAVERHEMLHNQMADRTFSKGDGFKLGLQLGTIMP